MAGGTTLGDGSDTGSPSRQTCLEGAKQTIKTVACDPNAYHPWERCNGVRGSSPVGGVPGAGVRDAIQVTHALLEPGAVQHMQGGVDGGDGGPGSRLKQGGGADGGMGCRWWVVRATRSDSSQSGGVGSSGPTASDATSVECANHARLGRSRFGGGWYLSGRYLSPQDAGRR